MHSILDFNNLSIVMVFIEGLISFFSPCVIPLLPLYFGYLSGNATSIAENGEKIYQREKVLLQTICFVLGISFSFLLLGLTFTALGKVFLEYQTAFKIIAGIMIIVLGLFQLGIIKVSILDREFKLPFSFNPNHMGMVPAFILGFLFSFTWTPCVGPALSSILLLVSTSQVGWFYVFVYSLGFVIPFLVLGIFTSQTLNFLKKKQNILPMVVKIGAVILLVMGVYTTYLGVSESGNKVAMSDENAIPEVELNDIDGNLHKLSSYKGKTLILTFWATWCPYCQQEMLNLEELHRNNDEVEIVSVLVVTTETKEEIKKYLDENNISLPVLIDVNGIIAGKFGVSGYPMSFVVSKDYEMLGYIPGYQSLEYLEAVIAEVSKNY